MPAPIGESGWVGVLPISVANFGVILRRPSLAVGGLDAPFQCRLFLLDQALIFGGPVVFGRDAQCLRCFAWWFGSVYAVLYWCSSVQTSSYWEGNIWAWYDLLAS